MKTVTIMAAFTLGLGLALAMQPAIARGKPGPTPPPPIAPSARFWHAFATADDNRLAMFGGSGGYQNGYLELNDLWFYNAAEAKWTLAPTGSAIPSGRRSVGWSCGGGTCVAANGVPTYRETWVYNLGTPSWSKVNCQRYLCPSSRMGPTMAYDPDRGYHVLFGGVFNDVGAADTYTFASGLWNAQNASMKPSARAFAAATYVPHHTSGAVTVTMNRVVLFGGYSYESFATLCDMWSWNGKDWDRVSYDVGGAAGPCLYSPGVVWEPLNGSGRLVVSGGYYDPSEPPRTMQDIPNTDTWAFTFTGANKGVWSKVTESCTGTPTSGAMMARDNATGKKVYFGGVVNDRVKGAVAYTNLVTCP